ncbi:MAG: hypothetical protein ABR515_08665, partial [Nitrososphaeraceae archaeon]
TYVNIITSEHPDGELSGPIYAKGTSTATQDITETSSPIEENDKGNSEEAEENNEGTFEEEVEESENAEDEGNEE